MVKPERALRVGVMQAGVLLEERLLRRRARVTIGPSENDTLVTALPRSRLLFSPSPRGWTLHFSDGDDGRVSVGAEVRRLADLRVERCGRLPLDDTAHGRVTLGELTVLFQLVIPPPLPPRLQLPRSLRRTLASNLDWLLVGVVAASFLLHFGFVGYLRQLDRPRAPDVEALPDHFVTIVMPRHLEPIAVEKAAPAATPRVAERKPTRASSPAPTRAQLVAGVQRIGVLQVLTARGAGTVADLLGDGGVSANADDVFAHVGGVTATASAGGLKLGGAPGAHLGGASLTAHGPGRVTTGERGGERGVEPSIILPPAGKLDSPFDPRLLVHEIQSRIGGLRACYEAGLNQNDRLGGKVTLRFYITPIGSVSSVEIEDDTMHDAAVNECMKSRIGHWRFPPPPGGRPAEFSFPFIFQPSGR